MPEIRTASSKEEYWDKLYSRFIPKYPIALRLYGDYGLLPETEGWYNIVRHCLLEAAAMEIIADELKSSKKDKDTLVLAALIHDFYKRRELELIKKEGDSIATLEKAEKESARILLEHGLDPKLVKITDAIGITKLDRIKDPSCSIAEKIMFYVDSITRHDEIVSLKTKVASLPARYPDITKTGIYPIYLGVSSDVEKELAAKIKLADSSKLPKYINENIQMKLKSP